MSASVTGVRRYPGLLRLDSVATRERSVLRRVKIAYGLLFFNTLTYSAGGLIPLSSKVGKALPNGALPLAILLLLTVNPKLKLRPNVFLSLVGLLVLDTIFTATQQVHLGTDYRTIRFIEFLVALWLMTPWWGRADMLLFRVHLRILYIALISVAVGALLSPGKANFPSGRLTGAVWPMYPTQVAQYGAIAAGLTLLLWIGRRITGRAAAIGLLFSLVTLILTHTRTALAALIIGLLVAGLSLFAVNARVRSLFGWGALVTSMAVVTAGGFIATWLARGENGEGLATLTGRTNFWAMVLAEPRNLFQELFGFGLSNAGVNGLPIDSNWLASYQQEGLIGVGVCAVILIYLLVGAFFQISSLRRAIILFLVIYCLLASITEDAFEAPSSYLLHLVIAASLLVGFSSRATATSRGQAIRAPDGSPTDPQPSRPETEEASVDQAQRNMPNSPPLTGPPAVDPST